MIVRIVLKMITRRRIKLWRVETRRKSRRSWKK
jgi:hypothetical protein